MEYFNMEFIAIVTGFLLIIIGTWAVLTMKNLLKIVIGFSIFDTGINVIIVSIAYLKNSTAPIIDEAVSLKDAASRVADPVPQSLVLTAIVIGLGVTALMLAYVLKLYKEKKSLDIESFADLKG